MFSPLVFHEFPVMKSRLVNNFNKGAWRSDLGASPPLVKWKQQKADEGFVSSNACVILRLTNRTSSSRMGPMNTKLTTIEFCCGVGVLAQPTNKIGAYLMQPKRGLILA